MQTVETGIAVVGTGIIGMSIALDITHTDAIVHVVERVPVPAGT